ncbi:galactokinase [Candidatus Binatia bacterium]|nr:galactokinase [Candidatus Binatia bacterium]
MTAPLDRAGHAALERTRGAELATALRRICRRRVVAVVRAPGRVNLLGEHTDYNGLPVLPMAIDRSVLVAVAPRSDTTVRLFNTASRFAAHRYKLAETISPDPPGDWANYSKAAAQGLMRAYGECLRVGADLLVDGTIPSGAGLSSSSALVVANALALLAANGAEIPYAALAELLPVAERYVGTLSGGMDQATSLLAQADHALRIDFFPLRVRPVPLPPGYSVIVCHSLVEAEKSGAARDAYNLRVIEGRLACQVLNRSLGASAPHGLQTLGNLATLRPRRPLIEWLANLTAVIPDRPLSLAEIAAAVGTTPERLRTACEVPLAIGDTFALVRRTRHVLSEADRVELAEESLARGDAVNFGRLMDASHTSCRDDYEISCPALEDLVGLARDAGALGARLTGAGFGGCTVNLVRDADVPAFLTRIDRAFYAPRLPPGESVGNYRFIFRPRQGAEVWRGKGRPG